MRISKTLALAASLATASAQVYQGFNYGSAFTNGAPLTQQDFENEFNTARQLQGTSGFTSARLFTTIQAGTANAPTQAIPAAIATKTQLLLGLFLSSTDEAFNNELAALRSAVTQYGQAFVDLVIGISVGSEDLYRISPIGIINKSNPGEGPDAVVRRINAVRQAISGTALNGKPVGHVDTWTAYVNSSNSAVIAASDFIGTDAYPYFQNTMPNSIENGANLFFEAYNATVAVSGGKPVWITETGWPVSGPTENQAVANLQNARTYWEQVACKVLGQVPTFWYTLQDSAPTTPSPSFGVVGSTLSTTPLYDLSCADSSSSSSSATTFSTSTKAAVASPSGVSTSSQKSQSPATTPGSSPGEVPSGSGSTVSSTPAPDTPGSVSKTSTISSQSPDTPETDSKTSTAEKPTHPTTLATVTTATAGSPAGSGSTLTPSAPAKTCPAALGNDYLFPHLIVPVDKSNPDKAAGTSYNGLFSPTVSSIFNFDYPSTYQGRTCTLVFLFPKRDQLETSNYTLSGSGGLEITRLTSEATLETTYNNQPPVNVTVGSVPSLREGNNYAIAAGGCFAGERVTWKVSATGSLSLDYFQDFNPAPIGLYVTVC